MRSGHRPCPARSWHTAAVLRCSLGLSTCRAEHQNRVATRKRWQLLLCCAANMPASQQDCCCPLVESRALTACQCTRNDTRTSAESLSTPSGAGAASLPRLCCASGALNSCQTRTRKSQTLLRGSRLAGRLSIWSLFRGNDVCSSPLCRVTAACLPTRIAWRTWLGFGALGAFLLSPTVVCC